MKTRIINSFKCLLLLALAFTVSNCGSDDDGTPAPIDTSQNPLPGFFTASGLNMVNALVNQSNYMEYGFIFKPTVNGKITAILLKIPDAQPAVRVSIWNKATATLLRTETVDVVTVNVEVTKMITALSLTNNTEYLISFSTNDWYMHTKTGGANLNYPFTIGDISVTGFRYKSGAAQVIPDIAIQNFFVGDVSFKFVKD